MKKRGQVRAGHLAEPVIRGFGGGLGPSTFAEQLNATVTVRREDKDERSSGIRRAGSDHYGMPVSAAIYQPLIASEVLQGRSNVALKRGLLSGRHSRRASSEKCDE